jgi:GTP-binding protein
MKITSAKFIRGIVGNDDILTNDMPKIAFIGRSNVGKSSLINSLSNSKVSRTSREAGSTRELNTYLINNSHYFVDLPGYGYARSSKAGKAKISDLIEDYLFNPEYKQKKIVLIIDLNVGMTDKDMSMYEELVAAKKDFIIAVSKIDKATQSEYHHELKEIQKLAGHYPVLPFSSTTKKGLDKLIDSIFN